MPCTTTDIRLEIVSTEPCSHTHTLTNDNSSQAEWLSVLYSSLSFSHFHYLSLSCNIQSSLFISSDRRLFCISMRRRRQRQSLPEYNLTKIINEYRWTVEGRNKAFHSPYYVSNVRSIRLHRWNTHWFVTMRHTYHWKSNTFLVWKKKCQQFKCWLNVCQIYSNKWFRFRLHTWFFFSSKYM